MLERLLQKAIDNFKQHFDQQAPTIAVAAPCKVNLMGEHVDYCEGLIITMGAPLYTIVVGAKNETHTIRIFSDHKEIPPEHQLVEFSIPSIAPLEKGEQKWANFVKGIIENFKGYILDGFELAFASNIPESAGLASSASLCVATYKFLEIFTNETTSDGKDKSYRCMKAETIFAEHHCSLMDVYSIIKAKEGSVMFIDCRDMRCTYIPFNDKEVSVLLINSNKKSVYTKKEAYSRLRQCEDAAAIMGLKSLRDARVGHLRAYKTQLIEDEERDMRARHVVAEIARSEKAAQAILDFEYKLLGRLMNQSHVSLKYDFEVSCAELDELVDICLEVPGVYGARMTGFGFGGCICALLRNSAIDEVIMSVKRKYSGKADFYIAEATEGAQNISYMTFNLERKVVKITTNISTQLEYAVELFHSRYGKDPTIAVCSPGRVTILGDHTETHHGYVLQMAIPLSTIIVGTKNQTNFLNVYVDDDFTGEEEDFLSIALPYCHRSKKPRSGWPNLIRSAIMEFKGGLREGFDVVMISTIPKQTGLSRDTSVIVGFYTFLESATKQITPTWVEKSRRCFVAEKAYTDNPCSLADHMSIIGAREKQLCFIDCNSDELEMLPFPSDDLVFLLTTLPDEKPIVETRFPNRETECVELNAVLGTVSLRDGTLKSLDEKQTVMSFGMYKRGYYMIGEMLRTYQAAKAVKKRDFESLGAMILQSNNSLRTHYEHVNSNLNQVVALTMSCPGVIGSKVSASHYNKCVLTLVRKHCLEAVIDRVHCGYKGRTLFYTLDPREGIQDITECLKIEMRRRQKDVEVLSDRLTIQSVSTEDLNELSWSMFDLSDEWADWDAHRRKITHPDGEEEDKEYSVESEKSSEIEFAEFEGYRDDDDDDIVAKIPPLMEPKLEATEQSK